MGTMMNDHNHRRWPCFNRYIIHKWVMFHLPMGKSVYEFLKIISLILKITNFEEDGSLPARYLAGCVSWGYGN